MRIFLLLILMTSSSFVSAQTAQENLSKDFLDYYNLIVDMKIEESMDYVIEDFFEILPKENFVKLFENLFANPEFEFQFEAENISKLSKIIKQKDAYYAVFTNNSGMKMRMIPTEENMSEEETEMMNSMMKLSFDQKFGAKNVSFNEETNFYTIYPRTRVCAKSVDGKTNWKFLNMEEDQMDILKRIIPKKVLKAV